MAKKRDRKIIAVVNLKGGVAKTTTSGYFAEALYQLGPYPVTAVDTDPERGFSNWHRACGMDYPLLEASSDTIVSLVKGLEGDVVIDTPPNDALIITKVCMVADEVFIPVSGTGQDINRLARTLALVKDVESMRDKPLHSVILTNFHGHWKTGKEALQVLNDRGIAVLDSHIRHLARYVPFARPTDLDEHVAALREVEVL